jgi:hypothetical protein
MWHLRCAVAVRAVPCWWGLPDAAGRNARVIARMVRDSPADHPGAATTSRTAQLRGATTSGGACAATLGCCVRRGHGNVREYCGRYASRCLLVVTLGTSPPLSDSSFQVRGRCYGGERWLAQILRAAQPCGGQRRRLAVSGRRGRRRWMVTVARDGAGRGAGISANRSAISRQRSASCCRRIHSASTIAVASSSRAVAVWVSVAMSLHPLRVDAAPRPGLVVRR